MSDQQKKKINWTFYIVLGIIFLTISLPLIVIAQNLVKNSANSEKHNFWNSLLNNQPQNSKPVIPQKPNFPNDLSTLSSFVDNNLDEQMKPEALLEAIFHEQARQELRHLINSKNIERYQTAESPFISQNLLIYGPPGTGKSHFARLICQNLSSAYLESPGGEFQKIYVGTGAIKLRELVEKAKTKWQEIQDAYKAEQKKLTILQKEKTLVNNENKLAELINKENQQKEVVAKAKKKTDSPIIIFIDEIDSLIREDKKHSLRDRDETLRGTFLAIIDEIINEKKNIMIIGTSNFLEKMDSAATRQGRFPHQIFIGYPQINEKGESPEYTQIFNYLKKYLDNIWKNEKNRIKWKKGDNDTTRIIEFENNFWTELEKATLKLVKANKLFKERIGFTFIDIKGSIDNAILDKIADNSQKIIVKSSWVSEVENQLVKIRDTKVKKFKEHTNYSPSEETPFDE